MKQFKKTKRITALALTALLGATALGSFTACGGDKKAANSATDLEIFYWNSGDGEEWLEKAADLFEEKYPECKVTLNLSSDNTTWANDLSNPKNNTIDLFISTMANFLAYTDYLEPLDDVLDVDIEEKGVKLIDKQNKTILDTQRGEDGTLYAAMWGGGVCGIVYNKTLFAENGYSVPRTSDELATLAGDIKDDGKIPFMHCSNADYWMYALLPWFGQYSGTDEVMNFWNATYVDEDGVKHQPDIRAMKSEGKLKALEALESCISPKGYTWSASNETKHTDAQTYFLNGRALMMPNGSWLENEMASTKTNYEFAIMRTPVISSLADKIGVASDKDLQELVSYVDSADYANGIVNDDSTEYSATRVNKYIDQPEIIAEVARARQVTYTESASKRMIIPNYAVAKDYAKKFVQFVQTDEVLKIFSEETHQRTLVTPIEDVVDTSTWSTFEKSAAELTNNADYVFRSKGYKLFYNTNYFVELYPEYAQTYLSAKNSSDKLSATALWDKYCTYYDTYWDNALTQAGLK